MNKLRWFLNLGLVWLAVTIALTLTGLLLEVIFTGSVKGAGRLFDREFGAVLTLLALPISVLIGRDSGLLRDK